MSAVPSDTTAPLDAVPSQNPAIGPVAADEVAAGLVNSIAGTFLARLRRAVLLGETQAQRDQEAARIAKEEREERERRAERREGTMRFFCALAARRMARQWAEEQHQKTERARVAARAR